jgi:uncharacterized protein
MEPRLRQAHFPGRPPIEAYGAGGFRFAGMSHRGSILCLPSGIHAWHVSDVGQFDAQAFAPVVAEAAEIEILLIGTGQSLRPLPATVKAVLAANGISADPMATGAAARTFNVLLAERRAVAAALLAVE